MNILSIQSHVAYGHVGNSAATFPLQRLGFEVWPVHTVMFAAHAGYGDVYGPVLPSDDVAAVIQGLAARGVLERCDAVLSGYIGDAALGDVVLDAVARVRAANPRALYACDPVMGDAGPGVYVRDGIPELMRDRAVPAADIVTPNAFELALLTGADTGDVAGALAAADALRARAGGQAQAAQVLVTSFGRADAPERIGMLLATAGGAWLVETPRLDFPIPPNGAGDATTALFTAHTLLARDPARALEHTAAAVFAMFQATHDAGARELEIVAAQGEIASPRRLFTAERLR